MSAFSPEKLNEVRDRKQILSLTEPASLQSEAEMDQVQGLPRWYIKVSHPPGPSAYPLEKAKCLALVSRMPRYHKSMVHTASLALSRDTA